MFYALGPSIGRMSSLGLGTLSRTSLHPADGSIHHILAPIAMSTLIFEPQISPFIHKNVILSRKTGSAPIWHNNQP